MFLLTIPEIWLYFVRWQCGKVSFVWRSAISAGVEGADNDRDLVDEEAFQHEWDMKREVIRNHFTYNQIEQNHSSQECFDFS